MIGPTIWNSLPQHIKAFDNLSTFRNTTKFWESDNYNVLCQNH